MFVKVVNKILLPRAGWLDTLVIGPNSHGRVLIQIDGISGMSRWVEGLLTIPAAVVVEDESSQVSILPGTYRVEEGQDKRGRRLLRFYPEPIEIGDTLILAGFEGHLVPEASSENVIPLLQCEGYSRTRANGSRFSLIAAPVGSTIAVEPYWRKGDPEYYVVSDSEVDFLGASDAVLHPDEW